MGLGGCLGEMAADGFWAAFMLFRELCGDLFTVADIDNEAPFFLACFEMQKRILCVQGFSLLGVL